MARFTSSDQKNINNKINECPEILKKYFNYIMVIKNQSNNTLRNYVYKLLSFFKFMVTDNNEELSSEEVTKKIYETVNLDYIKSLEEFDVLNYLYYLQQQGYQPATRNNHLSAIKSFTSYCSKKYDIFDIARDIESAKLDNKLPIFLTLEECKKVITYTRDNCCARDYCIVTLLMNCGMRVSELISINISDIQDTTIKIMGKGSKERTIYLNEACIEAIKNCIVEKFANNHTVDRNALFVSKKTGNRISSTKQIENIISNIMAECGLSGKGYSPHKLRHTAATMMYQSGTDIRALKDILGHNQLSTTQIYTHVNDKKLQDAINNNPIGKL